MNKLKVLVVSPQSFFRQGVWHSLSVNNDMAVATTSEIDTIVMAEIDEANPDITIIDVDGIGSEKMQAAKHLKQAFPGMGVILLSSNPDDNQMFQALKAHAAAYLKKDVSPEDLLAAVRQVANGEQPIQEAFTTRQKVAMQVLNKFQELTWETDTPSRSPLTDRETEILSFVARGMLNKQIATELGISEQTIKNHITSILRKLNASARTEAVVLAIKQGLITIS
ncbi:MAG: response regulator transcription factor [Dehalococcoidales bacterium]|nr:response regulator transcription factor [Dehalococcoidales bacterium]